MLEKIYNALLYSVLEYIHQLNMLSHVKYRNSNFTRIKKNLNIIEATQCYKQNCSEYNLSEKIYSALLYSVLEYIHQLNMLSHVKYRNSNLTRIKKIWILSRHPNVKNKIALNIICQKKYTMPYSTLFWSIYTNSVCSLM